MQGTLNLLCCNSKFSHYFCPDFFCSDSEVLDSMLDKSKQGKKTTKIVHFIRNPFSMVLSNYFYHAQSPTPEKWGKILISLLH